MDKNKSWVGGFLCGALLILFIVGAIHRHERHVGAQITTPDTTGMISPVANSNVAPASFLTCNAASANLTYINTTNSLQYYCDGTNWNQTKAYLSGTTGTIAGTLLAAAGADTGTVTVSGAIAGMPCGGVSATDGTVINSFVLSCSVTGSGANNVTVSVMAPVIGTPPSKAYNFRVWP